MSAALGGGGCFSGDYAPREAPPSRAGGSPHHFVCVFEPNLFLCVFAVIKKSTAVCPTSLASNRLVEDRGHWGAWKS